MNNKETAENLREIASQLAKIADNFRAIGQNVQANFYSAAGVKQRAEADLLDPPQSPWKDGDLALDQTGELWEYAAPEGWFLSGYRKRGGAFCTEEIERDCGPLRRIRIADPAKGEFIVTREHLAAGQAPPASVDSRVANAVRAAARDQLSDDSLFI